MVLLLFIVNYFKVDILLLLICLSVTENLLCFKLSKRYFVPIKDPEIEYIYVQNKPEAIISLI